LTQQPRDIDKTRGFLFVYQSQKKKEMDHFIFIEKASNESEQGCTSPSNTTPTKRNCTMAKTWAQI